MITSRPLIGPPSLPPPLYPGLRHNRIKNMNSKIKLIQMPCLVQTEALFDEDRGLSLTEWASIWKIQRLYLATQRPCLVKQTCCIVFMRTQRPSFFYVSNKYLFPQTPFPFLDRLTKSVLSRFVGPMRPLFGQHKYLLEDLSQNLCMSDTS